MKPFGTICFGLTKPTLFGHHQIRYLWRKKGEGFVENNTLPTPKHRRWIHYALGLCGNWGHRKWCASGRKNDSTKYQEILQANVQRSFHTLMLMSGWVFHQDNDPKHTSKSTMKYLQERLMKVLEWPPQSSDFNIIENLWRDLKHAVHARRPSISQLEVFCPGECGGNTKARIERLLAG